MPSTQQLLTKFFKRMMPNGRAFKTVLGGVVDKLQEGLAESEARAHADIVSLIDSTIPDNANFTADDATDWERRLGLAGGGSLSDRILAIKLKLNYPGTNAPRQHYLYIQDQLQAAGFTVYVHENIFVGGAKAPEQVIVGGWPTFAVHKNTSRHGIIRHGGRFNKKVANSMSEDIDATFVIGSNYRSTFFIGGSTLGTFANVPIARKAEFRQLILSLKPVQMVGYLFINFV